MKWIGQHIYDLVARFRNDVYLEDLSTTTETNVLVVDSTGKVSKTTVITGDVTGVTAGSNITVTNPTGPVPTVALSTNVDVAGTLDVTSFGTFDASVTVAGNVDVAGTLDVTSLATFYAEVTIADNVGIGTTSPAQMLDVVGKISLKDAGYSIFVGYEAGLNDDASANLNVGVGYQALRANTTGANNTAHGYQALYSNTTASNNTATGIEALRQNTTGVNNTAYGFKALRQSSTTNNNTALGYASLHDNTTGSGNVASGHNSLRFNTTSSNNTANGYEALYLNTTGANNSAIGLQALYLNTTGSYNSAHGFGAMYSNTTGANNSAVGYQALYFNTTGSSNTAIGREAGRFIADGTTANTVTSNSVFLGHNTKALAISQTNQIVIGDTAVGLGSNTAILGNSSITKTQLQGNVGIGTATPGGLLALSGSVSDTALLGATAGATSNALFNLAPSSDNIVRYGLRLSATGNDLNLDYRKSTDGSPNTAMTIQRSSGNVGIGTATPLNKLDIVGSLGRGAPVTKTTNFTVAATENWLIMNGTATITITLPTASSFTGRELMIKNIAAYTVISASSNVKPIDTDTAATAILPATAGSWCTLVSDGTNWVTMMN